jgi:hypothetical protein
LTVKKLKVKNEWEWKFYPLIRLKYMVIEAWIEQRFYEIELFNGLFWIEIDFSEYKTIFSVGIYKIYTVFGLALKYD